MIEDRNETMPDEFAAESSEALYLFLCRGCWTLDKGTVPLCLDCMMTAEFICNASSYEPIRADSPEGLRLWNSTAVA